MASTLVSAAAGSYPALVKLFDQWRVFERPATREGVPDYTAAAMTRRHAELQQYMARLAAIDASQWPVEQRIDYELVRAQMNGLDFDIRVLQPWARDPAFYTSIWTEQSDTPEHEGPVNHAIIELWQYKFPLSPADEKKLATQLQSVAPLLQQARLNLTGNAHDLWLTGTGTMQNQVTNLDELAAKTPKAGNELQRAI